MKSKLNKKFSWVEDENGDIDKHFNFTSYLTTSDFSMKLVASEGNTEGGAAVVFSGFIGIAYVHAFAKEISSDDADKSF